MLGRMELQPSRTGPNGSEPSKRISIPRVIAHRGYAKLFPENTLLALHQALKSGACYVEFDVQFCADGTPVLFHDRYLGRTTTVDGDILNLPFDEVRTIQACETGRFGSRFANAGVAIPSLADAIYLLKLWPQAHAFVELKTESMEKFGIERVAKTTARLIKPALSQCTIISYDALTIRCARAMGAKAIGWILKEWTTEARRKATELAPDYLFCNYKKIPPADMLWPGPWKWSLYDVKHPQLAIYLHTRGADFIETMDVGNMLQHPVLHQGGCFDGCQI